MYKVDGVRGEPMPRSVPLGYYSDRGHVGGGAGSKDNVDIWADFEKAGVPVSPRMRSFEARKTSGSAAKERTWKRWTCRRQRGNEVTSHMQRSSRIFMWTCSRPGTSVIQHEKDQEHGQEQLQQQQQH